MLNFEEFRPALEHVEKLPDRRQASTSFYLSVNPGPFAFQPLNVDEIGNLW